MRVHDSVECPDGAITEMNVVPPRIEKRPVVQLGRAGIAGGLGDDDDPDLADEGSPVKARKASGSSGDGVTVALLQQLMEDQTRTLLRSTQGQLDAALGKLEESLETKISGLDDRVDRVVLATEQADQRIKVLEDQVAALVAGGGPGRVQPGDRDGAARRQHTLVYGGWPRESRRKQILQQLADALKSLDVTDLLDDAPFTTGARRSMALSSFVIRPAESFQQMRSRMHRVLRALAESDVKLPDGRKLWCSFSKTPEERAHGAHASWVKRAVAAVDQAKLPVLDVEWPSGSVWAGEFLIASSTKPVPPSVDVRQVVINDDAASKPWVDCLHAGQEIGCTTTAFREALDSCKR